MELLFSKLKQKDVISVTDGKHLGKVCDLAFTYPENKVKGFFVTGCKGFKFTRQDLFIPMCDVVKIGEDVILARFGEKDKPADNCPPKKRPCPPPDCPPFGGNCPPNNCPPQNCPPDYGGRGDGRRDYGEYEDFS